MGVQTAPDSQPNAPESVVVAVMELQPFVIRDGEDYTGFSIDLWRAIASQANLDCTFLPGDSVDEQLAAVQEGRADLALAGISITSEREDPFAFSYPYFDAGLQILIRRNLTLPLLELLATAFSPAVLELVGIMILFILVIAHIFWLIERRDNPDFPRAYLPDIMEAIWWSAVTVTTVGYGDRTPRGGISRVLAIIWMFMGLFLIANFTAGVTSVITLQRLNGEIRTVSDLAGKQVATVSGSTADDFLRDRRIPARWVDSIEAAFDLLTQQQIEAIVYDAPVLDYYATTEGQGLVEVVGSLLEVERYGIAVPPRQPAARGHQPGFTGGD
ncbi:MAG: transporter substrate-binding domain-containing protein [Anaerolineae bacterium]|nr:transporter substrate-binding domain-containing protein [Anaerolineae bacterium]